MDRNEAIHRLELAPNDRTPGENSAPQLTDQEAYQWFLNDIAQWGPTVENDPIALARLLIFLGEHPAASHLYHDAANLCSQAPIAYRDPHLTGVIRLARYLRATHLRELQRRGLLTILTTPPPGAHSWPRAPGEATIYALPFQVKRCPDPNTPQAPESANPLPSAKASSQSPP